MRDGQELTGTDKCDTSALDKLKPWVTNWASPARRA
jgi:hypothetical protein